MDFFKYGLLFLVITITPACAFNSQNFDSIEFGGPVFKQEDYGCRWKYEVERDDWRSWMDCSNKRKYKLDR